MGGDRRGTQPPVRNHLCDRRFSILRRLSHSHIHFIRIQHVELMNSVTVVAYG